MVLVKRIVVVVVVVAAVVVVEEEEVVVEASGLDRCRLSSASKTGEQKKWYHQGWLYTVIPI